VSSDVDQRQALALQALQSESTLPDLLHTATREFVEVVDGLACAISRLVGDVLIQVAEFALDGRTLVLGHGYLVSEFPLTKDVLERNEPRCTSVLEPEPEPSEAAILGEMGLDSLLMLPLASALGAWGLAEIYVNGRQFTEEDVAVARPLAAAFGERLEQMPAAALR
jgi:hypothetical protein